MYNSIIKKYISLVTKDKIKSFGIQNEIYLSEKEIDIIYVFINNNDYVDKLLNSNEDLVFIKIKPYLSDTNFNKIKNLFLEYKNKFN